jgi:hypothetical protein
VGGGAPRAGLAEAEAALQEAQDRQAQAREAHRDPDAASLDQRRAHLLAQRAEADALTLSLVRALEEKAHALAEAAETAQLRARVGALESEKALLQQQLDAVARTPPPAPHIPEQKPQAAQIPYAHVPAQPTPPPVYDPDAQPEPRLMRAVRPLERAEPQGQTRPPSFARAGLLTEGAARFFGRVWAERVTGRFDFETRDGVRTLYVEEGRPVAADSEVAEDQLAALAQRDGLISRQQERALRSELGGLAPRTLAVRMVERQLLKQTELYGLVRRHLEQVAYSLFGPDEVRYRFLSEAAPVDAKVALPQSALAFWVEGVRRKGDEVQLSAALGGPSALVRLREHSAELADLGLTAKERRLVGLIDGLRTQEELVFASGLDPSAAVRLLGALQALGVVEVLAPARPTARAEASSELLIDLSRVAAKYEQVRNGDYFEILGVPRQSTSYEVRQAFDRLSREFHPARFAGLRDDALPGRLSEIGRMLAEAVDVLADDHTRRAYAQHLTEG